MTGIVGLPNFSFSNVDGQRCLNVAVAPDPGKENSLGNPPRDGFTLVSTAGGVRSWSPFWQHLNIMQVPNDFDTVFNSLDVYFLDGIIDLSGTGFSVEVPLGGVSFKGHTVEVSKITCSDDNYTLFTSPASGSGNLLGLDYAVEVTGTSSKVYDIKSATGFEAFEFSHINYNNCTDLGIIDNYRQGLEVGTGRFGGTPSLELRGAWSGGYFIDTSIARGVSDSMSKAFFSAGAGFVMQSRFRSNMNIDLGATAAYLDFSSANMPNPNTLQLQDGIIMRNGVPDSMDNTVLPNIDRTELPSMFGGNVGISNTFVGGELKITVEQETPITGAGFHFIEGTWTASDLQHFDSPASGQIRHLSDNPIEYKLIGDLLIDGGPNDELEIRIRKFEAARPGTFTVGNQIRVVNNFQGGRDVAIFSFNKHVELTQNDYLFLEISNNTDNTNITAEIDSSIILEAR